MEQEQKAEIGKAMGIKEYVSKSDEFYWNMTKERIANEVEKLNRRITALAITSTVITAIFVLLAVVAGYLK